MNPEFYTEFRGKVIENCKKVIVGKDNVIEKVLIAFLSGGHVLLDDVPGTGKTMLLKAFAVTVGGTFKRIQFTPDLLPSDLTGIHFYNQKTGEFQFRQGPLFANLVLADEINRATPRTQSALLEAMAEGQITVDGDCFRMEEPFMIMATQNPLESYGTFPLPEAQNDRFLMRLSLGYMDRRDELAVLNGKDTSLILEELEQKVSADEIAAARAGIKEVEVSPEVSSYLLDIVTATRNDSRIRTGVSTRGAQALYRTSQASAALKGRSYVTPDDVKELAPAVLAHRITTASSAKRTEAEAIISELLKTVTVPFEASALE